MVKKITYLGDPQYQPQRVAAQIPNFENSGVRYQTFYKRDLGGGNFELRKQDTRVYSCLLVQAISPSAAFARANTKNFFATKIQIDYSILPASLFYEFVIYDGNASNFKMRFIIPAGNGTISLDVSDCPRKFTSANILLVIDSAFAGANEYIHACLYGWDEE